MLAKRQKMQRNLKIRPLFMKKVLINCEKWGIIWMSKRFWNFLKKFVKKFEKPIDIYEIMRYNNQAVENHMSH